MIFNWKPAKGHLNKRRAKQTGLVPNERQRKKKPIKRNWRAFSKIIGIHILESSSPSRSSRPGPSGFRRRAAASDRDRLRLRVFSGGVVEKEGKRARWDAVGRRLYGTGRCDGGLRAKSIVGYNNQDAKLTFDASFSCPDWFANRWKHFISIAFTNLILVPHSTVNFKDSPSLVFFSLVIMPSGLVWKRGSGHPTKFIRSNIFCFAF